MEPHDIQTISASVLATRLGTPRTPVVIDVRDPDEFAEWSIPQARNIPLSELATAAATLDAHDETVVVCASGKRSHEAAVILTERGVPVLDLLGGMQAWALVYDSAVIELAPVRIVQLRRRGKGCLSYVVGNGAEAFVIDPSLETEQYLRSATQHGWAITRVFDTHLHADHVSGARALAAASGATLHLNPADSFEFDYEPLTDGQYFTLDQHAHIGVRAFATPGHTKGSTIFQIGGRAILSGDTLFVDGVGRPDLAEHAEEFARDLYQSLHTCIFELPADSLVLPAHYGPQVVARPNEPVGATLATLRSSLTALQMSEAEFIAWTSSRSTPRPPNFASIVAVNIGHTTIDPEASRQLELGPNRCAA